MKTGKKRLAKVEILTETDNITGEILNSTRTEIYEHHTIRKTQVRFKMIQENSSFDLAIYKLKSAIDYKVVIALADFVNKKDDTVTIDIHLKKQLAQGLGYGIRAIEQSISALKEHNAITPISKGRYLINPEVIFVGGTVNLNNKQEQYDNARAEYEAKKQ